MSPPLYLARLAMAVAMAGALTGCAVLTAALSPHTSGPPTLDDLPPDPTQADLRALGGRMEAWAAEHCRDVDPDRPTLSGFTPACEETISRAGMLSSPGITPEAVPMAAAILDVMLREGRR